MLKIGNRINMEVTDDDAWRYERLHIVIGYLYSINEFAIGVMTDIKDEKGTLIINWITEPLPHIIKACQEIWSSDLCCEPEEKIEHYVNGKMY